MLKILTRDNLEPISISAIVEASTVDKTEYEGFLNTHNELKHAVMFLLIAAELVSPDDVRYQISRLIFSQVAIPTFPTILPCVSTTAATKSTNSSLEHCLALLLWCRTKQNLMAADASSVNYGQ